MGARLAKDGSLHANSLALIPLPWAPMYARPVLRSPLRFRSRVIVLADLPKATATAREHLLRALLTLIAPRSFARSGCNSDLCNTPSTGGVVFESIYRPRFLTRRK